MEKLHVTIADVAKLAQVSKMSVSRVLNGQAGVSESTRQRIMEAVEHLGYVPNPGLRPHANSTRMIALLITDITTTYMGEIVRGVSGAAEVRERLRLVNRTIAPSSRRRASRRALRTTRRRPLAVSSAAWISERRLVANSSDFWMRVRASCCPVGVRVG